MKNFSRIGMALLFLMGAALTVSAAGDWNDSPMGWLSYEDGLAKAKENGKPVCLIFYTDWCPVCERFSKIFHDEKVVELSKSFVMVRVERDSNVELSEKYSPDGEYIPRTFFLSSQGELDASLQAPREKYRYFYNPATPGDLMAGMQRALDKLSGE